MVLPERGAETMNTGRSILLGECAMAMLVFLSRAAGARRVSMGLMMPALEWFGCVLRHVNWMVRRRRINIRNRSSIIRQVGIERRGSHARQEGTGGSAIVAGQQ